MSALPPKADIAAVLVIVRKEFGVSSHASFNVSLPWEIGLRCLLDIPLSDSLGDQPLLT